MLMWKLTWMLSSTFNIILMNTSAFTVPPFATSAFAVG